MAKYMTTGFITGIMLRELQALSGTLAHGESLSGSPAAFTFSAP